MNDSRDPGRETKFGISRRSHSKVDIKAQARAKAVALYTTGEWLVLTCNALSAGLDLVGFDAGVNSGVGRGARWLQ